MDDLEYRDLIERAHLLKELQNHPGWSVWHDHVRRRIDAKQREMLAGRDSLEAYRYTAGWIEGMAYALDALGELDRQVKREAEKRKTLKTA